MSQRDYDLMESVSADEAISVPALPPPRDSAQDADSSLTRKRPRLDMGAVDPPVMHADSTASTHPVDQQVEMTIRSQPPSLSSHTLDGTANTSQGPVPTASTTSNDTSVAAPVIHDVPASPDLASAGSPPILLIEDEDDDAETMDAYTAASSLDIEHDADSYFATFPFTQHGNFSQAVHSIIQHLQGSHNVDGSVFPQLTCWLQGLPSQPRHWRSFYLDRFQFWEDFYVVVSKLLARRAYFGEQFAQDGRREDEIIETFLAAYLRAVARLMQIDAWQLSQWEHTETYMFPVVSQKHFRHLTTIISQLTTQATCHLFVLLKREYGIEPRASWSRILQAFLQADGLRYMFDVVHHAFGKVSLHVQNMIAISTTCAVEAIGWITSDPQHAETLFSQEQFGQNVLAFFREYNADLQVPSKVLDTGITKDLLLRFATMLFDLCRWNAAIAIELAPEILNYRDPDSPTIETSPGESPSGRASLFQDTEELPKLIANVWKFKVLRKYIVKGRMELRVMGIGFMDNALVDLWKEYNATTLSVNHPVMQYLADFLLHERLVDYIISVDSHPQLISRSGNIVGFLVVTHRYSNAQTDAIWNTVSYSSDPRMVSATMTMLRGIFGLMDEADQLYLGTKLYELPIESCTIDILRFLRELTHKLQQRQLDWTGTDPKARPWNVCIRVMQDTSPSKETTKLFTALHTEAFEQLRVIAPVISLEERHRIFQECITQIAGKSAKATASVRIIHVLASTMPFGDTGYFKDNPNAARNILEELCAFVQRNRAMSYDLQEVQALQYRLELLSLFIHRIPDAIPVELYEDIWDHLIGKYAHTNHLRDMAWSKFLDAVQNKPENDFCEQLVTTCVPALDPQYYTIGLFDFVAAYKFPTISQKVLTEQGEKELLQIRGADLLWAMILSAPPQTIEDRAARLLASRYLELDPDHGITLEGVEQAHIALVDQCMEELLSVYKSLRSKIAVTDQHLDPMDVVLSDAEKQRKEQRFGRTILFLKLLLASIRTKPEFNHSTRSDSKVDPLDIELPYGEAVEIKYQCPVTHEKRCLAIGSENTLQDLYNRLCRAVGLTKINLFAKGQRLNVMEHASERVIDLDLATQWLLVQKAPGSETTQPIADRNGNCSVFETTVLNHFDDLFVCMDAEDYISSVVYDFLICFPYRDSIPDSVVTGTASSDILFPPGKPCQARYAAIALDSRLREQVRKNSVDDQFLVNSVCRLDEALLSSALISPNLSNQFDFLLAGQLVNVLLHFLKERPAQEVSCNYFSNERGLVDRLFQLVFVSLNPDTDNGSMAYHSYATMVEASLHSRGIWEAFTRNDDVALLHIKLLLSDSRKPLREAIAKVISSVCGGALSPSSAISESDTATSFWKIINSVIPRTLEIPGHSEQIFELADEVFRKYDEHNRDEECLRSYLQMWSDLLLGYQHVENVGQNEPDSVVMGLTKLLLSCVSSLKSFKKPMNTGSLVEKVWRKFLFAPGVVELDNTASNHPLPVLESKTRRELYDLVLALAEDRDSFGTLLGMAENLRSNDADIQLRTSSIDRANEIRAPAGYVGLLNPRAICYMNSLLTQLFMNVNFRKFMLDLNVTEPLRAQSLLHQTQRLFAHMQNSYRKSADPRDFAACVKAPEGAPIDINVQMDADEFYNLLFDQWEAQMLSPDIKERFRSFYGGHTVNQIKSKECEHVSERIESFFVVQCDVQGKQNLHESLQAFVEGDVMEGDNKYKCESCGGKLVDAIKRTCLKDVGDNLIFHLKRFDFDLVELRRAKINDHFDFPTAIDVSQFKIDHISDPSNSHEEDIFELVGVLVHQGTSENGHYYSYIRERPSPSGSVTQWVEFNDRDVDAFDHQSIPYHTYGGFYDDQFPRQQKQFSAYMLFYQRRTAIEKDHCEYISSPQSGIAKVPVPPALDQEIGLDNSSLILEYSLYDPHHARFLKQALANLRTINHGTCSENHEQETQALHVVLRHLSQRLFRSKIVDNIDETMAQLRKTALSCSTCCQVALKWLAAEDFALVNLLFLGPYAKLRSQIRNFLIESLCFLREVDSTAYGIEAIETDNEAGPMVQNDGILVAVARSLYTACEESSITARGWDDLYFTLCQMSHLGNAETGVLLDLGFLEFILRIFCMHAVPGLRARDPDMWKLVEKKKRIYNRMIEFVFTLLSKTSLLLPVVHSTRISRLDKYDRNSCKFPLTREEKQLLVYWHEDNRAVAVLDKMLEHFDSSKTEIFYPGEILKWMLQSSDHTIQRSLFRTVAEGVAQLQPPYSDPYVRAALHYCDTAPSNHYVEQMIDVVSKSISRHRDGGGEVGIQFSSGLLKAENDMVSADKGAEYFYQMSFKLARTASVSLLLYDDEAIRKAAMQYMEELFIRFKDDEHTLEETLSLKFKTARILASEMCQRIADEYQNSTSRSYMQPMMHVCQMLVIQVLQALQDSRDPSTESFKSDSDQNIIDKFETHIVPRIRTWPMDEDTPVSTGEPYDHSDYSESDVDPELLDI